MYFLVENTNQLKIIDSCEHQAHKSVILNNYCMRNNVIHVRNRQEINDTCKEDGIYTYKISENKYIVLDCKFHGSGYFINQYIEKHTLYYLEFVYFVKSNNNIITVVKDIIDIDKKIENELDNISCDSY